MSRDAELRHCTRREWIFGAAPAAVASVLSACQEKKFTCDHVTGLPPQGIQIRQSVGYVDRSKTKDQDCLNCHQYVPPPSAGQCGTCKVMPGPAHPLAWCKVWVQKT
jgi:hypothetical protein